MPRPVPAGPLRRRRTIRPDLVLVSVAGLAGRPVANPAGAEVGKVADVVARWDGSPYPPVTGLVVRVGRRRAFIAIGQVASLAEATVRLNTARVDLADFERRSGEVVLGGDVIDHQLVDVDGVRVVRAADLYVAQIGSDWRLVAVDVGLNTLLRRLGPARWRTRPTPERVIDWARIQPFGRPGAPLRLAAPNRELRRLRPAELADLLEELGRSQRQEFLAALEPDVAADALEEMHPDDVGSVLRDAEPGHAAALVAEMEPDEAVDALRDLADDDRSELLAAMEPGDAAELTALLNFPEDTAGGLMTTNVVAVAPTDTVAEVRRRLSAQAERGGDVDAVLVVGDDGALVDDITLLELLVASDDTRLSALPGGPSPVTVTADTPLAEVVDVLIDNRRSSIVVVDDERRPIGRILADDVVDALVPERGRHRFPRILS